uniref:Uncharacterized protein n=1 Tax=Anguilla anguilla TaxID=7936 RepID=A0A0E9TA19_ANGAN
MHLWLIPGSYDKVKRRCGVALLCLIRFDLYSDFTDTVTEMLSRVNWEFKIKK